MKHWIFFEIETLPEKVKNKKFSKEIFRTYFSVFKKILIQHVISVRSNVRCKKIMMNIFAFF